VEVPTHVGTLIEYAGGGAASLLLSFDSPLNRQGFVEITGTEATMATPDPNRFDGEVRVHQTGGGGWQVVKPAGALAGRGLGVLDMARALRAGEPHRATGQIALHVLDIMVAIERSIASGAFEPVDSEFTVPPPLPEDWDPYGRSAA
jgi:predicted dehydrogenase